MQEGSNPGRFGYTLRVGFAQKFMVDKKGRFALYDVGGSFGERSKGPGNRE